jgi:hypothetical protein
MRNLQICNEIHRVSPALHAKEAIRVLASVHSRVFFQKSEVLYKKPPKTLNLSS